MIQLESKYQPLLLEALEELMYKLSLQLNETKGDPLTKHRKQLSNKQKLIEELQHKISIAHLKND